MFRSKPLEDALGRSFTADAAKAVKIEAKGLNGDLHGSPEYRAHLIAVMAARGGGRRADPSNADPPHGGDIRRSAGTPGAASVSLSARFPTLLNADASPGPPMLPLLQS